MRPPNGGTTGTGINAARTPPAEKGAAERMISRMQIRVRSSYEDGTHGAAHSRRSLRPDVARGRLWTSGDIRVGNASEGRRHGNGQTTLSRVRRSARVGVRIGRTAPGRQMCDAVADGQDVGASIGWGALEEVFLSWLIQRLPNRTRQEIEKMLIGELPELVETRAGQDLIEIGVERGLAESVGIVLEAKRGRLSRSLRQRIRGLQHDQLRRLLAEAVTWESIEPLDAWLSEHGQ